MTNTENATVIKGTNLSMKRSSINICNKRKYHFNWSLFSRYLRRQWKKNNIIRKLNTSFIPLILTPAFLSISGWCRPLSCVWKGLFTVNSAVAKHLSWDLKRNFIWCGPLMNILQRNAREKWKKSSFCASSQYCLMTSVWNPPTRSVLGNKFFFFLLCHCRQT